MLILGQNIIGEPTTVLFRKHLLAEPFGTLNGRKYGCSVDMASWISLLSRGDAMYITEPLSSFRLHTGQQVHHKFLEGCEDFSHLVLTSKKYGFLQDSTHYKSSLLKACEWHDDATNFYRLFPRSHSNFRYTCPSLPLFKYHYKRTPCHIVHHTVGTTPSV